MSIEKNIFNPLLSVGFQKLFDKSTLTAEFEPIINPKNSAFNKNFGTVAGTVAQGNHSHIQLHNQNTDNEIFSTNYAFVYPLGDNDFQYTQVTANTPIIVQFTADKNAVFDTIACLFDDAMYFNYLKIYENDVLIYDSSELKIEDNIVFDDFFNFQGIVLNRPIQITNGKIYKIEVSNKISAVTIGEVKGGYFIKGVKYLQPPKTSITYSFNGKQTTIQGYSLGFALINANLAKINTKNGKIEAQGSSFYFNGKPVYTSENLDLSNYEPIINPKNSAFNKNFGTVARTVAEGNHTHSTLAKTDLSNVLGTTVLDKMQEAQVGLTNTITFKDYDSNVHTIKISKGRIISWTKVI